MAACCAMRRSTVPAGVVARGRRIPVASAGATCKTADPEADRAGQATRRVAPPAATSSVHGKRAMSPDTAIRCAQAFGQHTLPRGWPCKPTGTA